MTNPYFEELAQRLRDRGLPPDQVTLTVDEWTWRADAFHERDVLNHYGDEGWEVERVDAAGRFVSHRDPENPQRWEYRRETVAETPPGRTFFSKRFYLFITAYACLIAAICATGVTLTPDDSRGGFLAGVLLGALLALTVLIASLYLTHRRKTP